MSWGFQTWSKSMHWYLVLLKDLWSLTQNFSEKADSTSSVYALSFRTHVYCKFPFECHRADGSCCLWRSRSPYSVLLPYSCCSGVISTLADCGEAGWSPSVRSANSSAQRTRRMEGALLQALGQGLARTSQKGWCLPENKSNSPELVQTLTSCLFGCFGIAKDWIITGGQAWTQGRQPTIFDSRYVMFQILYRWYDVDTRGRLQADKDDAEERSRIEMQRLHAQERCSNLCICVLNHHESPKSPTLFIFVPTQSISCYFTCRPLKTQHGFEMTKRSSRHCDLPPGCHLMETWWRLDVFLFPGTSHRGGLGCRSRSKGSLDRFTRCFSG